MDLLSRFAISPPAAAVDLPAAPAEPLDIAALIGPAAWNRLPATVRHRFARTHVDATYEGALDLDCSLLGRCFALMARLVGGPLTGNREQAVPASVRAYADGQGGMVWERHLALPGRARCVRSTKLPSGVAGTLIERTDGGLSMELDVFEENGALVFQSRRYFFVVGRWRNWQVPLPLAFTPGVCRVEHLDQGKGLFRFTMAMHHPWWGRTFHQTGLDHDPEER